MTTDHTSAAHCSAPARCSAPGRCSTTGGWTAPVRSSAEAGTSERVAARLPGAAPRRRRLVQHLRSEVGAATAEYAIVIMAAVGFAGVLLAVMRSDEVRAVLSDLVRSALSVG
jgi:hypothetical protein